MKKWFYLGLLGLAGFEILKVYFIMPMPGSQQMDSLQLAYALHHWRWVFRLIGGLGIVAGAQAAFAVRWRWGPALVTLLTVAITGLFNFVMMADKMFKPPQELVLKPRNESTVDESSVVIGVEQNGEARAYPIRYLVYHHQVQDQIGGVPVLVTYCSVCRTGRVFAPVVDGHPETFRLVGMDHFNAMFEDQTTGSWWRQATGEAVAGPLTGTRLADVSSSQVRLSRWFDLHPDGRVMQPEAVSTENYDTTGRFERGESRSELTGTNPASWQEKSWVVGVQVGGASKAYDWNRLKQERVINDQLGDQPIVIALATDDQSFVAFVRPGAAFSLEDDRLLADGHVYDFAGRDLATPALRLSPVSATQEFWHSWRTFHPETLGGP